MFKTVSTLVMYVCIFATGIVYAGYDEDVAAINKGMPKSIQQFNKRQIECNHWAGEEPYDKARAKEIATAFEKLKCDTLEKDEIKLIRKYKSRPSIIESINKAKTFF